MVVHHRTITESAVQLFFLDRFIQTLIQEEEQQQQKDTSF